MKMEFVKRINFLSMFTLLYVLNKCLANYHSSQYSIDTNPYKTGMNYDLLLTLKLEKKYTPNNYIINCFADSDIGIRFMEKVSNINQGKITEYFEFSGLTYYFIKFEKLSLHQKYEIYCSENSSSFHLKGQKNFFTSEITFPKQNSYSNFLTFGDWGECELGQASLDLMKNYINTTDSIAFLGDLAYDLNYENGQRGNNFMKFINDVTLNIPLQLSPGNHENYNKYEEYQKRFYLPNRTSNKTFYYSYDVNNVHFISLNSEVEFDSFFDEEYKTKMINWLIEDLKQTNKKWKIAYMHRPVYCSMNGNDCIGDSEKLRNLLEDIFIKYKLDLVVTGHRHNYERLLPIMNYNVDIDSLNDQNNTFVNPKYPVYAVCGATGNNEEMETNYYPPRNYSKIVGNTIGICNINVDDENLNFKHILTNNTVFDEFNIIKNKTADKINEVIQLLIKPAEKDSEMNFTSYIIDAVIIFSFLIVVGFFVKLILNNYRSNNLKKIFNEEDMNIMNLISVNNM